MNFKNHFKDAHTNLIKVRGTLLALMPYKQTNDAINKLTHKFSQMQFEVLESVNVLINSYEEILSNIHQEHPLIASTQITSIYYLEQINSVTNDNNDL